MTHIKQSLSVLDIILWGTVRYWIAPPTPLSHLSLWWMGTVRLAATAANLSPITEGDKRLQWQSSFATGDLGQQPPQRSRKWRVLARTPELIQEQCTSIRGDTSLWSWQVYNWPAGRQGDKSWNKEYSYKICDDMPSSQLQYGLDLWFRKNCTKIKNVAWIPMCLDWPITDLLYNIYPKHKQ